MMRRWGALLAALALGVLLAFIAVTPPSPRGMDTPLDQFSSARAMVDIRVIAAKPHPTGSEENAEVRAYLADRLTALGLEVQTSESLLPARGLARLNRWSGADIPEQNIVNVIGTLPGTDRSKPALLLMAHHDTVWGSPGAADDTIGVASILEIIRAVTETGPPARDLIVLFTDGEEVGLSGAINFFETHPLRDKIGVVINFEARGGGGTVNLFQTSANNGAAARLFARSVKQPSATSLSTFVYNVLPNDTDLTPALKRDYVAYNLANIGRAEYYHSPKIDADALSQSTVQHMGSQGLDLTRALLSADGFPAKTPDATFFDVFGFFTIIYAPIWGWLFLAGAVVFYRVAAHSDGTRKEVYIDALKHAAKMLGFIMIGALLLFGLNWLSGAGKSADYYDRLAAISKLEVMVLFSCLGMFFWMFGRKAINANGRLFVFLQIFILGFIGQIMAPTASYFITLPLLLCAVGSFAVYKWPDTRLGYLLTISLSALVIGYMLNLSHQLMLGVGPDLPSVVVLPAALIVLAGLPLYPGLSKRVSNTAAIAGIGLAVVMALWIRIDPIAATVPLY